MFVFVVFMHAFILLITMLNISFSGVQSLIVNLLLLEMDEDNIARLVMTQQAPVPLN